MKRSTLFSAIVAIAIMAFAMAFPEHVSADVATYAPALFAGVILDVFNDDAFSVVNMTRAINKLPFIPGRATQLLPWDEEGVTTFNFAIESQDHVLRPVNPTPRGGPGETIPKDGRKLRVLRVPHFERDDAVYADEVSGVREFGSEQSLQTVQGQVNKRMGRHTTDFDLTTEYYRVGALKGIVLNPDGSTLYNLYTEFDEAAPTTVDLTLGTGDTGQLREKTQGIVRTIGNALGGGAYNGAWAFVGDTLFDKLLKNAEVRASYKGTSMAQILREGYVDTNNQRKVWGVFEFGGIVFENYRGAIGGTPLIDPDEGHVFPMNVPGFFRTVYAPADYVETVNTIGLPRYAKQFPMPNGKGIALEMQTNALSFVERPGALVKIESTT